ncbi:MAG: thioesterase family protein [Eubacteriales bacterium]|nr:thioesterase family protein [Eubacteriales bacterium]
MTPYEHKVQYYETDGMGIVHHSNYIRWFEEARVALLEQLGYGYDRIEAEGFSSPVLEVHCRYKAMARFGDTVQIAAQITAYNGVRMTVQYEVRDAQTAALCCTGESGHCFMGRDGRPVSLKRSWPELDRAFRSQLPSA